MILRQSTAVNITILMIDSADHVTGKTGLSAGLTIYATKAGTSGVITPTVTEVDATNVKGLYKLALTTSHTDTLGELQLHITAAAADPTDVSHQVQLVSGFGKNTLFNTFEFFMRDSVDHLSAKTGLGAGVTAECSIDGAAFAACTNAVSELSAGVYKINLSAADLNGDYVTLKFTASGADMTLINVKTNQ